MTTRSAVVPADRMKSRGRVTCTLVPRFESCGTSQAIVRSNEPSGSVSSVIATLGGEDAGAGGGD